MVKDLRTAPLKDWLKEKGALPLKKRVKELIVWELYSAVSVAPEIKRLGVD